MGLANGWRFSCGGGSADSTILNDSTAWPLGGSFSGELWPRSAVSYKRWLGNTSTAMVPLGFSADHRGLKGPKSGCPLECRRLLYTGGKVLDARVVIAPDVHVLSQLVV